MTIECPKCKTDNPDTASFCNTCAASLKASEDIPARTETLEAPKEELTTGSTFAGRYQIIEELGRGGMGRVYKATDTKINEKVALKLIKPEIASDKKTLERFGNELRIARKIVHKNVGRMYDINEEEGTHYITMEYVSGQDLKGFIRQSGQMAIGTSVSVAKQICEGLSEAHKAGVIHRDLKPSNIMIDREGNVRIMDFGIARSLKEKGITGAGVMIGTPEYMSPEQAEAEEVDQRSDIYSLGVILYEMVTGRVPFEGDSALSIAMRHKGEKPKDPKEYNAHVPDDLSNLIMKCLEKDKESRYQSAGEVQTELENIEKGFPTTDRAIPRRKPITSKEITVTFGLRRLLAPALVFIGIVIIGVIIWQLLLDKKPVPSSLEPEKPSIAVLPFQDFSQQKDQEYLCMGIATELINRLNKVQDLWVPARASSFSFKGKEANIQEIGSKLKVGNVLTGTLQKADSSLRISVELVNVADNNTIWQKTYQRNEGDIFNIQDEISLAVLAGLKIKLLGEEREKIITRATENTEAYHLYLRGLYHADKYTEEGAMKALDYFQQAIDKDGEYALAYAGVANAFRMLSSFILEPEEGSLKAKSAVTKALGIDESLAEVHTTMGMIYFFLDWNWSAAEKELKHALELDPNDARAHHQYSLFLGAMGRHEEAIAEIRRAQELDPLSLPINNDVAWNYFSARQYGRAIEYYQKTLELDPNYAMALRELGSVYVKKGMFKEAIAASEKAVKSSSADWTRALLAYVYAAAGRRYDAMSILNELLEQSEKRHVSPALISQIYASLGENDNAFEWLEIAYQQRDASLAPIKISPKWDNLRSDPRFKALMKKMGLE